MKREILIFTVLITNIAFASTLPREVREVREIDANKNNICTLVNASSMDLHKRGLDENIAKQKVLKALGGDKHINSIMAQNIVNNLNKITNTDIVEHISTKALYGMAVDLSSYDEIIGIVQKRVNRRWTR